jgi:hypothetical protein
MCFNLLLLYIIISNTYPGSIVSQLNINQFIRRLENWLMILLVAEMKNCLLRHALTCRKDLDATEDHPPQLRAECH